MEMKLKLKSGFTRQGYLVKYIFIDDIIQVLEFSKPRLSSLDINITIEVVSIENYQGIIKATKTDTRALALSSKSLNTLNSYFCYDDSDDGVKGVAALGTACRRDGYAVNINEYHTDEDSFLKSARVFVHELGHNLGMR